MTEFNCILSDKLEGKDPSLKGIYTGELVNYYKCVNIDYENKTNEQFNCLQLDVQGLSGIEESLKNYVSYERLEGDNKYEAGIHGKQEAKKGIKFLRLPPVLQLILKRFDYNQKAGTIMKINDQFDIQETLDLDQLLEFDENADKNVRNFYYLHSIVMHKGSANAGHYFAYIKNNPKSDHWLEFNDETVVVRQKEYCLKASQGGCCCDFRVIDGKELYERKKNNNCSAYMLFYVREEERESILEPPSK